MVLSRQETKNACRQRIIKISQGFHSSRRKKVGCYKAEKNYGDGHRIQAGACQDFVQEVVLPYPDADHCEALNMPIEFLRKADPSPERADRIVLF